jgi:hypothetical protein
MTDSAIHPQPLLRRERWISLDGERDFALDAQLAVEPGPGKVK